MAEGAGGGSEGRAGGARFDPDDDVVVESEEEDAVADEEVRAGLRQGVRLRGGARAALPYVEAAPRGAEEAAQGPGRGRAAAPDDAVVVGVVLTSQPVPGSRTGSRRWRLLTVPLFNG